jgi:hypothetical protein
MARLWRTLAGRAIWWLTKCEETAFIADYLEVASFIEARYSWKAEFEDNYFHRSEGLSQKTVDNINTVRKRRSLTSIVITETDADEYARDTALDKPAHRRKLREELTAMSAAHRAKLVDECRAQIQLRPPPHRSFDELQEEHRRSGHLNESEIALRVNAVKGKNTVTATKPNGLDIDTAVRMLQLTENDPEVVELVATRIAAADLLALAEKVENKELRKTLVMRLLA